MLSRATRKEIVAVFPEVEPTPKRESGRGSALETSAVYTKVLVVVRDVYNVPQEILAVLFGVGKTSIHPWIYAVCSDELEWPILREIVCWSGQVSFDEKWVRITGGDFVLCAVDSVSGFPLLIDLYPTLDTVRGTVFFTRFHARYGVPSLIQSAGSRALAAARAIMFAGVR